jgi:hypothetical protein
MAFYTYEDTGDLGIVRDSRRESARHQFVDTWRFRWLPDRDFKTFGDLQAAVAELSDEAIAAEKAKWPQLGEVLDVCERDWPNRCWRHRDRKAAIQACVATSWIRGDGAIASLCADCGQDVDAADVIAVVEERRAAVAARKSPAA